MLKSAGISDEVRPLSAPSELPSKVTLCSSNSSPHN